MGIKLKDGSELDEPEEKDDWPMPKKTFTPIGCLVCLYPFMPKSGRIALPENRRGPSSRLDMAQLKCSVRSLVIAVGPDCKWVKEGDEVLCWNPTDLCKHKLPDGTIQTSVLVREDHISAIVDKEFFNGRPEEGL